MSQYIKLTNKTANHNNLQLIEGLNIDPVPFCPTGDCIPGGIYFTIPKYLCHWLTYRDDLELVWEVEIPKDAKVHHELNKSKADKLILKNPIPIEKYLIQSNLPLTRNVFQWAANIGNLNILKDLHSHMNNPKENESFWDEWTCAATALHGHLDCLKYAHEHGCPWNGMTCSRAASKGHLECLQYAHENGCPWDQVTCELAAKHGQLNCLKYAYDHGCPWAREICTYTAAYGQLDCLKYLHSVNCPWTENTCAYAAENGYLDCLKYAHKNGCPWNQLTSSLAESSGSLECIKYVRENHCPT